MCLVSTNCVNNNNAISTGNAGWNTESCLCNYGFVKSIVNTNGTLTMSCSCPTGFTSGNGTNYTVCCPANSSIVAATNNCSCNSSANPPYY